MTRGRRGPLRSAIGLSLEADRSATLLTIVIFCVRPIVPVAMAYLVKVLIDAAVAQDRAQLIVAAVAMSAIAAILSAVGPLGIESSIRMIEATTAKVDERLMRLVGGLTGIAHLDDPKVLDRVEVLRQERVYLAEGADAFSLVLGVSLRALITGVLLAFVNPWLLLTPLLVIPALIATNQGQNRRTRAIEQAAADSRLAGRLYEIGTSASAGKEIRLFGIGAHLRAHRTRLQSGADGVVSRVVARALLPTSLGGLVFALGFVGSLLLVMQGFRNGDTSLGDVILALTLVTSINIQMSLAVSFFGFLQQTIASSRRLLWLESFFSSEAEEWKGTDTAPERLRTGVELDGVSFSYPGQDTPALRDLNLRIPAGSVVAVVGGNGAGKSTLIKLLNGLYQPSAGRILIDGKDLAVIHHDSWREHSSACFQDFAKLEFVARQSVGLGDLPLLDDDRAVMVAVRDGAAAEVVDRLPRGLDSPLGSSFDDGAELSGGQWQRIALARARMRRHPLLLTLDEPTAAIDPIAEDELLNRYVGAARQTARSTNGITLFASHRLSTARSADLILVIDSGRLTEVGTHDELMSFPEGIYRDLFDMQAKAYR